MAEAAAVHRISYDERLPWLAGRYTPAEVETYFTERVFRDGPVWGAFAEARLTGILAFRDDWIEQLYVLPSAQEVGIGSSLLDLAKTRHDKLRLWTFQRNARARSFYEKRGFIAKEQSDGSRNDEREPDVRYEWRLSG